MMPWQALPPGSSSTPGVQEPAQYQLSQQQTLPQPVVPASSDPGGSVNTPTAPSNRRRYIRMGAVAVTLALTIILYFIWRSPTTTITPSSISQQNFSSTSSNSNGSTTTASGDIKVYVLGAVKHPGVYTLPADARVSDLLQAAGGPLPGANLVALNLAAKLSDGQEVL